MTPLIHLSASSRTSADLRVWEEVTERHRLWVENTVPNGSAEENQRNRRVLGDVYIPKGPSGGVLILKELNGTSWAHTRVSALHTWPSDWTL